MSSPCDSLLTSSINSNSSLQPSRHWFAVYCMPRHEKRVAQHCGARQIEHLLPTYSAKRHWKDGSRRILELPLFPNYIFVCIDHFARWRVLDIPGVVTIVGHGKVTASVPDADIEMIRASIAQQRTEPYPQRAFGKRVQVIVGPLTGMQGVLLRAKTGGTRMIFTIETINRSMAVEVDAAELECIDPCDQSIASKSRSRLEVIEPSENLSRLR